MQLSFILMRLCVYTYSIFALKYLQITEIFTIKCFFRIGLPNLTLYSIRVLKKYIFFSNWNYQGEFGWRSRKHECEVIMTLLLLYFFFITRSRFSIESGNLFQAGFNEMFHWASVDSCVFLCLCVFFVCIF